MKYEDAIEYLRIAENAFNIGAFSEAAQIVEKISYAIAYNTDMPSQQRDELIHKVKGLIARFQFCPDECCWEETSSLSDLFRD